MCGRFTLKTSPKILVVKFDVPEAPPLPERYNIAPTQLSPMVVTAEKLKSVRMGRWFRRSGTQSHHSR